MTPRLLLAALAYTLAGSVIGAISPQLLFALVATLVAMLIAASHRQGGHAMSWREAHAKTPEWVAASAMLAFVILLARALRRHGTTAGTKR